MRSRCFRRASLILGAACLTMAAACGGPTGAPVRVIVPPGAHFAVAAESLASRKVIVSAHGFRAYAALMGRDRELKPGTYLLRRGTSWDTLIDALTRGKGLVHTVTIPEGFALTAIAAALSRALEVPAESVIAAAGDTALRHRLDIPTSTVEGYLFPDTYVFPDGTSARQAVGMLVQRFEQLWKPQWDAQLQKLAMSRNDIMTLASIIEKEAKLPEERPVISAVYHNRLKKRMPLQADPTVQYALGHHVDRVLFKDLTIASPYNTYKYPGLPPGPIASPGLPSIEAALFPADVPYLYFVANPDGHHEFRRTIAEHNAAIRKIKEARKAAERQAAKDSAKAARPAKRP